MQLDNPLGIGKYRTVVVRYQISTSRDFGIEYSVEVVPVLGLIVDNIFVKLIGLN